MEERLRAFCDEVTTDEEYQEFTRFARERHLSILDREVVFLRDNYKRVKPYITRDGWLKIAKLSGDLESIQTHLIFDKDYFEVDNMNIKHIKTLSQDALFYGAYCMVKKKSTDGIFTSIVHLSEVYKSNIYIDKKTSESKIKSSFERHPVDVVCKKCEINSLKKAFAIPNTNYDIILPAMQVCLDVDYSEIPDRIYRMIPFNEKALTLFNRIKKQEQIQIFTNWYIENYGTTVEEVEP